MSTEKQLTVRALVTQPAYQARFAEVLKNRAPQFILSITSQCDGGPLAKVDPKSVVAAAFVAATLDLPIDRNLGMAWIVPYKGTAQFQLGYRGFIQLALRTAQYERLNAFTVNAEAWGGMDDFGEPVIDFSKLEEEKEAVAYAFKFRLKTGFVKCVAWTKAKVEKHAKRYSQSFGAGSSPWKTHFDEMALKTVIANGLKKWGILSIELQQAFAHDQGAQIDIDADVQFPDAQGVGIPQGRLGQKAEPMQEQGAIDVESSISEETLSETEATPATAPEETVEKEADEPQDGGVSEADLKKEILAKATKAQVTRDELMTRLIGAELLPAGTTWKTITRPHLMVMLEQLDSIA